MAKLYFNYSAMNAGKSTLLLQASYNYHERGMNTMLMTSAVDDRTGHGIIASRIGLEQKAEIFHAGDDLLAKIEQANTAGHIDCVFIDEAQFLSDEQVWQLARVADGLSIPVMCYGLRTDFQGKMFPGSATLLAIADHLREIRTICWCGRKAIMVARLDGDGKVIEAGEQVLIGGEESYVSLCRTHWRARKLA